MSCRGMVKGSSRDTRQVQFQKTSVPSAPDFSVVVLAHPFGRLLSRNSRIPSAGFPGRVNTMLGGGSLSCYCEAHTGLELLQVLPQLLGNCHLNCQLKS